MNEHEYYCFLKEFWKVTNDGFIIVDPEGIIIDINEAYCHFLGKTREQVLGRPIGQVISTTSMYDVLASVRDGDDNVYLQLYGERDNASNVETHAVANRFCFFDERGNLLGAAAQMSFKERAAAMAYSIASEELNYYKRAYEKNSEEESGFDKILGNTEAMQKLKEKAIRVAKKDFPVLITGETGTGKELFAQAIHRESSRRKKPIISINCASIPSELLESELFGYDEGAFTGAKRGGKIGKFQLADGGTIFLDEIGDLPLRLQAKLLRVLQEHEIEKVGGGEPIPIDVRFISATRQNLAEMVERGEFREDLYYRLNVVNIETLPLREHPGDILLYANHVLNELNTKYKTRNLLSDRVKYLLMHYRWPGNVRELINVITSAYAICDSYVIEEIDLPGRLVTETSGNPVSHLKLSEMMEQHEAAIIRDALRRNNQNCKKTAEELGIDRSLLYRKMRKNGIVITREIK